MLTYYKDNTRVVVFRIVIGVIMDNYIENIILKFFNDDCSSIELEELLDLPEVKEAISKAEHDEISDDNTDVETTDLALDPTDMKSIDKKLDKIEANQKQINQQLSDAIDYSRDIKNGLREDIVRLERIVDKVEDDMNKLEDKTRTYVDDAEERFDTKRDALLNQYVAQKDILIDKVEQLKKYMDNKLQRALDNPLAK